ncbi:putative pentatricopeptide repeat-containing protein At3g25970 [Chenopodium quinoa]|uniref:putative pentatricopeptide repeat-containing protein At3g25970 n=1 Tax=Chenopodium quinoa TaxID=63459 RepID=UPI000B76C27F|nr:putative pentatricopeptide repeat-containing protein At3g25970 [Chenopodium quinoa]
MKTLRSAVKSCFYEVPSLHCHALKLGTIESTYDANVIVSGYAKHGHLKIAHQLFDEMSRRDTVSWNTMIAGYVNSGSFGPSWKLLIDMRRRGFAVDKYTFGSILKGVASNGEFSCGEQLHSMVIKAGSQFNVYTASSLLNMYAKCGRIEDAYSVFKIMPNRSSVSWNAMIAGFVEQGDFETAFELFDGMGKEGAKIEDGTVAPLLTVLNDPDYFRLPIQLHSKIIKLGLSTNNIVCNALLTSYSECGSLEYAEKMFYGAFDVHDLVTWNSMLGAYLLHNKESLAFKVFVDMQLFGFEPDIYTYTSVVRACFKETHQLYGKCVHCLIIKRGLESSTAIANALIAMYMKSTEKAVADALRLFESIDPKDSVSWNSVVTGFSQFGFNEDAIKFFGKMRSHNFGIDHYSLSAVLRSCADLAALQLGRQIHALTLRSGLETNEHVAGSLIFMYTKCGLLDNARKSFEETPKDSPITWNFIIFGYAQHGQGKIALELFHQMTESKVKLDHVTFVAVLTACSHMGWVEEGRNVLKTMESKYGITLRMEHYACAIDLFGRAGLLGEVKSLVKSMPFEPDVMVWKTVLGACRSCGDVEYATKVANHLLEIAPQEHCSYVILSDIYGRLKRWEEKANLTRLMRERGIRKVPGSSWIEINNEAHAFNAEGSCHTNVIEIYATLEGLMKEIRMLKDASNLEISVEEWALLDVDC